MKLFNKVKDVTPLQMEFHPYVMHTSSMGGEGEWNDVVNQQRYPYRIQSNAQGFTLDFDLELVPTPQYLEQHRKKPGDRVVIFTGGSTVHGVGATANAQTVVEVAERVLNDRQSKYHYRVLNLGMGSWVVSTAEQN